MVDVNCFCHSGTSCGVGCVEGSHEVVEHQLHRTVDHMVAEPWIPSDPSRTPHICLHEACTADARAALLETVFVLTTLHQGRASGVPPVTRASHIATRRTASAVPSEVLGRCREQLDQVNLAEWFLKRIPMLKTFPHFSRKVAAVFCCGSQGKVQSKTIGNIQAEECAWKVFGLIPMMLMHRPRGTGLVGRSGQMISRGAMDRTPSGRKRDRGSTTPHDSSPERDRGPNSQGTSSIESCAKRPVVAGTTGAHGGSIGSQNVGHSRTVAGETTPGKGDGDPSRSHGICAGQTTKCLQSAPSGCAPGPGGCSNEMLRVCLDDCEVFQFLFRAAEDCASASMPESVSKAFMSATMTARQKPDGGVRGIATGTSFRRLVAKTLARQFGKAVESTCAPFQFALSTRAGTDCVGHVVRALTDKNPMVTVLSIDGVGAYDHVYRSAMMKKLYSVPSLRGLLPFVRATNADPTQYVWEDEAGVQHRILQAEGGEQGTL